MKKKSIYFLFLLVFKVACSHGQVGEININIDKYSYKHDVNKYSDNDSVSFKCVLIKNDSSLYSLTIKDDSLDDTIPLPVGIYTLQVYMNNILKTEFHSIEIKKDTVTNVSPGFYIYPEYHPINEINKNSEEPFYYFFYGPKIFETLSTYPITASYSFGFNEGGYHVLAKHYSIGGFFGSGFLYAPFKKGMTLTPSIIHQKERYTAWNFSLSWMNRFTIYDSYENDPYGLHFDFGVSYNLPIFFRHVIVNNNIRIQESNIHKINDFSAILRIGYLRCAFQIEFALTDYLKMGYPEIPRIKFGIIGPIN